MSKYKDEQEIVTTDGFWYDISDGGYIKPEEVLTDQVRAKELKHAINLLRDWQSELINDEKLILL
jgi:hypothetical protein